MDSIRPYKLGLKLLKQKYIIGKSSSLNELPNLKDKEFFSLIWDGENFNYIIDGNNVIGLDIYSGLWNCLKIDEKLDFNLSGILSSVLYPLSEAKISIFVSSTYDTDFIFIEENNIEFAINTLTSNGFIINGHYI